MTPAFFSFFQKYSAYGVLFLRLAVGTFLLYGVQDNVFSWERMLEFRDFLEVRNVPYPLFAAHLSVYVQFICGLLLIMGGAVRWVSVLLILNFTAALLIAHIGRGQSFPEYYPAVEMLCMGFFFLFNGAGPMSLDALFSRKNINRKKHTDSARIQLPLKQANHI
jgi:putative oxidoreductase